MREWERKIVGIVLGWCPKAREPETSVSSLARALKIKEVLRKNIHVAAIFVATAIGTSLLLVSLSLSYPVAPPLKQNVYTQTFTDSKHFVSLDVVIYYETELDGTWRIWYRGGKEYNVTVLLRPTFINTSAVSTLRILQTNPYFHPECATGYWPVELTPLESGIDLYPFWTNSSAWTVGSGMSSWARGDPNEYRLDYYPLWFHFVFRLIQTDGTREIFVADDAIRIPFTSTVP